MTQAGRQGSPRKSSGRKGPERNSAGSAGRGAPSPRGGSFGAGQRDFSKGGDRPYKAPKPREERFIDPDEAPAGEAAGRPAAGDWKSGAKPAARKPGARKPGAGKAPGTPGAL